MINDPLNRPSDISYLNFPSTVNRHIIDLKALEIFHNFELYLRLFKMSSFPSVTLLTGLLTTIPSFPTIPSVSDKVDVTLSQLSNTRLVCMSAIE